MDFLDLPDDFAPARTVTVTPVKTGEPVVLMDYEGAAAFADFKPQSGPRRQRPAFGKSLSECTGTEPRNRRLKLPLGISSAWSTALTITR